jgi:hypothetical protein
MPGTRAPNGDAIAKALRNEGAACPGRPSRHWRKNSERGTRTAALYQATVAPDALLASLERREGGWTVVVDPAGLTNIEKLRNIHGPRALTDCRHGPSLQVLHVTSQGVTRRAVNCRCAGDFRPGSRICSDAGVKDLEQEDGDRNIGARDIVVGHVRCGQEQLLLKAGGQVPGDLDAEGERCGREAGKA